MKPLYNIVKNVFSSLTNASSSKGGGSGSVNRDPKAISVKRDGLQINESGGGRDNFEEPLVDLEVIDNAIAADSYMMMAMLRHSELVSKSGFYFKSINDQALEYLEERLIFMEVGTGIKTEILVQEIIDDLVRYSNAFLIKARSKSGEGLPPGSPVQPIPPANAPIAGYFRVHPKTMTIARDDYGEVLKYKQEVQGGESKEYRVEDVIHFTLNKPSGRAFAIPWAYPVLEDIRLLRKIEENVAILIYKHIFPLLTYQVGQNKTGLEATQEEVDEVRSELERLDPDGIIVMPERHQLDSLKLEPIDIEKYLEYFENRVFSGLGMSHIDMGRGDTANRNTADSMDSQKIDRIKNWQKQIQAQIDHFIVDELLVEGGFDPLINPEFDVDFIFEEIENEKKIALENHSINKFNNNLITFEEARLEIGEDINADEGRLHFNMIGSSKEDGTVENNSQPENQHGKRTSPKDAKESSSISNQLKNTNKDLAFLIEDSYESMRKKDRTFINFESSVANKKILEIVTDKIKEYNLSESTRNQILSYGNEWSSKILKQMSKDHKEANKKEKIDRAIYISIKKEQLYKRAAMFIEYVSDKAKNLELIESELKSGSVLVIEAETDCSLCSSYDKKEFSYLEMTEMEKKALYYNTPPYHTGCKCKISRKE